MATVLGNMKLRGTPASAGKVVSEISRDSLVEILLTRDDWHLVQAGEFAGWVRVGTVVLNVSSESLYPKQQDILSIPPQIPPPRHRLKYRPREFTHAIPAADAFTSIRTKRRCT